MVSSIKIQGLNEWLLSFERLVSVSNSEDRSWPTAEVGFSAVKDRKLCVAVRRAM